LLGKASVHQWLTGIQAAEHILNATTALVAPDQYVAGTQMVHNGVNGIGIPRTYEGSLAWPSVFSGMTVIGNRCTPPHRDRSSRSGWYDLLFSCGTDKECYLDLPDIGAKVRYYPGDACFLTGSALQHAVRDWEDGNRVAYAHYHRFLVAERMGINPGTAPTLARYSRSFYPDFLSRNWKLYGKK
jgi:hypothetical protein